jgi:hypothetical protein
MNGPIAIESPASFIKDSWNSHILIVRLNGYDPDAVVVEDLTVQ